MRCPRLLPLLLLVGCASSTADLGPRASADAAQARAFYVDPEAGDDQSSGTLDAPFRTLDRALQTVSERVDAGIRSDTIYLRGGVYRKESVETLWRLNLHGTPEAHSVISAMPADSGAPGAVRRKSGRWYERVVFDDGQRITSRWTRVEGHPGVWQTDPGYTELEWTHQNVWPWTRWESDPLPTTPDDDTPTTTSFTVAPYMVLQEGEPFLWADDLEDIDGPGVRSYDHETGILYLWPHDGADPNTVEMESWYGGPEPYREGILYLDGDGRALFDGDMRYAELRGIEFRMFVRLFEFARHGYPREEDRGIQQHVVIEDNEFRYGWKHFLIDSNTVHGEDPPGPPYIPRYEDRSDWLVRNNVFYRPSREVFQVHGDNHVFEHNLVIDHIGPWAGPAGVVGALNARNMRHFTMRYNVFEGHANVAQNRGSIFMVEVGDGSHADAEGNYIFGDLTVENNLFLNVSGGASLVLGKGGVRMRNITVRGNVFDNQVSGRTIQISSPHENLVIENNLFRGQGAPLQVFVTGETNPMTTPPLPSTISIRRNIFVGGRTTIDEALFDAAPGSEIEVSENVFFANEGEVTGSSPITADPLLRDPDHLDYRLRPGSPAILPGPDAGPYDAGSEPDPGMRWWSIMAEAPRAIPPGTRGFDPAELGSLRAEVPYPPSPVLSSIEWDPATHVQFGLGSDQWPMTTAADGSVFGSWGDGWGWAGEGAPEDKRSIGITRITGMPPELAGEDVWGDGPGRGFGKPEALIALGDTIRMFWTKGDSKWDHATWGASSFDGGRTWELGTSRIFSQAPAGFRVRAIVQYGPGYEDAPDDFVYVYFGYNRASDLYLARAPRGRIFQEASYQWFAGTDAEGGARWTPDFESKVPAFHDANGYVWHVGISYLPDVHRYLLVKPHYAPTDDRQVDLIRHAGIASLGVFDASTPWGPWGTVYYEDTFLDELVKFSYMIPTAYLQPEADALWLAWSGWPEYDNVNFIRGKLNLRSEAASRQSTARPGEELVP